MKSVAILWRRGSHVFSRKNIRDQIGVNQEKWLLSYTAIFQGMRVDHPGGAPSVNNKFRNAFKRINRGEYTLTDYGKQLLGEY